MRIHVNHFEAFLSLNESLKSINTSWLGNGKYPRETTTHQCPNDTTLWNTIALFRSGCLNNLRRICNLQKNNSKARKFDSLLTQVTFTRRNQTALRSTYQKLSQLIPFRAVSKVWTNLRGCRVLCLKIVALMFQFHRWRCCRDFKSTSMFALGA